MGSLQAAIESLQKALTEAQPCGKDVGIFGVSEIATILPMERRDACFLVGGSNSIADIGTAEMVGVGAEVVPEKTL